MVRTGLDMPPREFAPPGDVRGFDVRTGKLVWTFHTVPHEGEFGHDTWKIDGWERMGHTNVWTSMSYDADLGYVYLPGSEGDYLGIRERSAQPGIERIR